jgi:hypothetical protein
MCAAPDIEERVDRLEAIFGHFMVHTDTLLNPYGERYASAET